MTISVVIPVIYEQSLISDAIERLRSVESEGLIEIIVVDGSDDGNTLSAIRDPHVIGLSSEKGRSRQMNRGATAATGDIILFLHVDTVLPRHGLKAIGQVMEDDTVVAGAFDLAIADSGIAFSIIERVASVRSRLTHIPYGDQAIFIRRDYFQALGGYKDLPIMEDVDLMRRIKRVGGRICIINTAVLTSSRRWRAEGIIICTFRNWAIILLYLCGVSPARLSQWYK